LTKIIDSSLLVLSISIYLEFRFINFETAVNVISFIVSVYTFFFILIYNFYGFKRLNTLENTLNVSQNLYLEKKFEELIYDTKYREIDLNYFLEQGTLPALIMKNYH
jgi:hypothetical protein